MRLWRVLPLASIIAAGLALGLLALAPLGTRLGWWHYNIGLYGLIPASATAAALAAALAVIRLASGWSKLGLRTLVTLLVALAVGSSVVYPPLQYIYVRRSLPSINDIATDTGHRPPFHATSAARAAESGDRIDTPEPRLSRLQRAGYPDIVPFRTALPPSEAFSAALAVAQVMPAWSVVAVDEGAGRIEASARSRWFGFTDDIVVRVTADPGGSRIDMRSASRKGSRDYGVNAARIRAYLEALRQRIG
jgi:uncharacterized protein (DUF1499 family)